MICSVCGWQGTGLTKFEVQIPKRVVSIKKPDMHGTDGFIPYDGSGTPQVPDDWLVIPVWQACAGPRVPARREICDDCLKAIEKVLHAGRLGRQTP